VYDLVQAFFGARQSARYLSRHFRRLRPARIILDVGGGTGRIHDIWGPDGTYLCLDNDLVKLKGYRAKHPNGSAILGDGAQLPIRSSSVDIAICIGVAHHLSDTVFPSVLDELHRVLRPAGHLVFLDPVWQPRRPPGRLLWKLDRGAYPRTAAALRATIERAFQPVDQDRFAFWHEYLLWVGSPRTLGL
jgi:SAM-dependent methyltransferase